MSAVFVQAADATAAEKDLAAQLPGIFARSCEQYRLLLKNAEAASTDKRPFPQSWDGEKLSMTSPEGWCSGFFPGSLWLIYEYTRDGFWKEQAERYTAIQERIRHYAGNHDIGFMLMTSVGNALRLAPKPEYPGILLDGAAALSTRYNEKLGVIRSWGKVDNEKEYLVIIDNMMNLELLEWASKNGGGERFDKIAQRHAEVTDRHHFRPDGSAYHVLNYNQKTPGKILEIRAGQGASVEGTWARGHSWGIYGFTMMFRETQNRASLMRAIRAADYLLDDADVPEDGVPYWDHKAWGIPHEERDASAAAVAASALLELAQYVPEAKGAAYRAFAVKSLRSLASPAYFAKPGANGGFLLMHSVGSKPARIANGKGGQVNVPLNYADYYFLEALLRFRNVAGGKPAVGR